MDHLDEPLPDLDSPTNKWIQIDAIVLSWIYSTISEDLLLTVVKPGSTARDAWLRVKDADVKHQAMAARLAKLEKERRKGKQEDWKSSDPIHHSLEHVVLQQKNATAIFSKHSPLYGNSMDLLRGPDGELPEKLRGFETCLIERISNEIMDHDPNVRWDDIGCRSPGRGLLLFGPPGTGKTMIGKAIAGEAKATFFYVSASSLTSKWLGESEQLVRALFAVASCRQPAVIFVDEIDSMMSQRKDGEAESYRRMKTQFLIEMERFEGGRDQILLIGATNRPQELDEAARRRLTKRLYVPLPSSEARAWIIRNLLEKDGLFKLSTEDIDSICKLTEGYSGSDMKNLVKDASMGPLREAFTQGTEITNLKKEDMRAVTLQDFENSLQEVRPSVSLNELGSYEFSKVFQENENFLFSMLRGPDGNLQAKLRSLEPHLIERITNEIMHKKPDVRWEDIAGLQYAKKCVTEMAIWPLLRPDIFKGCRSPGRGLLLFGPPGTGKTMIGKAIAGEAKATYVGEGEKLVRALFGVASSRQPAVIFVDEIDSLLSQRKSNGEHEASRRLKTQFLIEMEGCDTGSEQILLIGKASNLNSKETLEQRIDHKTLMRQLGGDLPRDFIFHSLPQANHHLVGCKEARAWIVRNLLEKDGLFKLSTEDIDTICKLTEGSDMKNLVKDASMGPVREAFKQGAKINELKKDDMRAVTLQDFENALQEVRPSVSPNELGSYEAWNISEPLSRFFFVDQKILYNRFWLNLGDFETVGFAFNSSFDLYSVDMLRGPDGELPAKLRSVEPYLIERITNEIMNKMPDVRWEDIAGLQYAKKCVTEMVVWPLLRPDIFKGCRSPERGLLLFGPPGTGKTMIGKAIAGEAKATFFYISASSVLGKWMGESEKLVRALFGVASCHQPAVIFVDEIDSLLSRRSDGEHDITRRIKTQFLIEMEGCDTGSEQILVIGEARATNRPQDLDEAARRRLTKRLYIPLPSSEARAWIVRNLLEKDGLFKLSTEDIDSICKSTEGSDMKNLVKDASMGPLREAFKQGIKISKLKKEDMRAVTLQDFENALQEVRPSVSLNELGSYEDWNNQFGSFSPSTMQPESDIRISTVYIIYGRQGNGLSHSEFMTLFKA
ncbi:hypothetical protein OSB04_027024 [Centaurea solstitialis]|uniref:AAA+ ATPase domain-containing protein n=1 Tax=Centaurea solstitialis TaxID=347529 RepID=A0AA38SY06_9ASTR|nr:hypothetical protein OSB04_027024 [Centaurea solstitialis]